VCEAPFYLAGRVADEQDRLGLNTCMRIQEVITKPKPPLTPDQARIDGLKAQVKRSQDAVKAERARQKVKAGQQALASAGFAVISETMQLKTFQVQVRLVGDGLNAVATTELQALNALQARAILQRLFGGNNILSVSSKAN
jgi:hypothetical protein